MTRLALKSEIVILAMVLACASAYGQVLTGIQPFSSNTSFAFDTINNANLNTMFSIPIVNKAGRGMPFNYNLTYNSSVWVPVGTAPKAWQPVSTAISTWGWNDSAVANVGKVTYNVTAGMCQQYPNFYYWSIFNNFVYTDGGGTTHPLNITVSSWPINYIPCGSGAPATGSGLATDGSGYNLSVQALLNGLAQLNSLTNKAGDTIGAGIYISGGWTGIAAQEK